MTRETRVGLVLGLFFIFAFGMILSELKGTGEQSAQEPNPPVVENDYYRSSNPKIEELAFAPADGARNGAAEIRVLPSRERRGDNGLVKAALVRRDPTDDSAAAGLEDTQPPPSAPSVPQRTYRVQPGDTLYAIAQKLYGPNNGYLFKSIYEANRDRLPDASTVYVDQVLVIPPLGSGTGIASRSSAAAGRSGFRQMDMEEFRRYAAARAPRRGGLIYVVQSGDNLTRIAQKIFNDTSNAAVERIFEANRDKLYDKDSLVKGMKLRIPS